VLGIGMGMFMQPLVLAMQNIVRIEDLGAGTSTNNFARSLGGAVGTAVLGAVMTARLDDELSANLPGAVAKLSPDEQASFGDTDLTAVMESPTVVAHLPDPVRVVVQQAFTDGLDRVFVIAACIAAVTIVLTLFMPNLTLRSTQRGGSDDPDARAAEIKAETSP
jgi:hypothetical protein